MTNPLLTPFELPPFSKILPEHVVPAVTKALNDCRENVERLGKSLPAVGGSGRCAGAYLLPDQPPELGEK